MVPVLYLIFLTLCVLRWRSNIFYCVFTAIERGGKSQPHVNSNYLVLYIVIQIVICFCSILFVSSTRLPCITLQGDPSRNCFGQKNYHPFQKLIMESYLEDTFVFQDLEKLVKVLQFTVRYEKPNIKSCLTGYVFIQIVFVIFWGKLI